MLSEFQEMAYYHTEFSKHELTALLESSGFDIVKFHTYFAKSKILTKLFSKFPVLRFMGTSIVVIGVKEDKLSSPDQSLFDSHAGFTEPI